MDKRRTATVLYAFVGVVEVGDFVINMMILPSSRYSQQTSETLGGLGLEQVFARELLLVLLTAVISGLFLATAWGFYKNTPLLKGLYRWAVGSLAVYVVFHFITAITLPAMVYAWYIGAAYGLAAAVLYVVGKVAER